MKIIVLVSLLFSLNIYCLHAQNIISSVSTNFTIIDASVKNEFEYTLVQMGHNLFYFQKKSKENVIIFKNLITLKNEEYLGNLDFYFSRIYIDDNDNSYICGSIPGFTLINNKLIDSPFVFIKRGVRLFSDTTYDYFGVLKFDSKGHLATKIKLNGYGIYTNSVCTDEQGNIYFGGIHFYTSIKSNGIVSLAAPYTTHVGPIFISKADKFGQVQFITSFPGYYFSKLEKIVYDKISNQLFVAGHYAGRIIFENDTLTTPAKRSSQFFLACFDPVTFKYKWNIHAKASFSILYDFAMDNETIYAPVVFYPPFIFENKTYNTSENAHTMFFQVSKNGTTKNLQILSDSNSIEVWRISHDWDEKLIVGGLFRQKQIKLGKNLLINQSDPEPQSFTDERLPDGFFAKMTKSGQFISAYKLGGQDYDWINSIYADEQRNTYHIFPRLKLQLPDDPPYPYKFGRHDLSFQAGLRSTHIIFQDELDVSIREIPVDIKINLFPNPVSQNFITIQSENLLNGTLSVINLLGQDIKGQKFFGSRINLDITDISNGIYFLKLETNGGFVTKKFVVSK